MSSIYVKWVMTLIILGIASVDTIDGLYRKGKLTYDESVSLISLLG